MCPLWCPLHLLLLHHPFADHLVDRRLDEPRADPVAVAIALTVIDDRRCIVPDVGVQLVGVATFLGHSSLNTTRIYVQPTAEKLAERVERLDLNAYAG